MKTSVEWLQDKLNNVKPTEFCSIETIKKWVEQAKEMHDFANNSEVMKQHAIGFKQYIDNIEIFSLRTLSDEERYKEYVIYLTNKEK